LAFVAGGSTTITFTLIGDGADCNVDEYHPVTFTFNAWASGDPEGSPPTDKLHASPSSITFTGCGVGQPVTFSSDVPDWYCSLTSMATTERAVRPEGFDRVMVPIRPREFKNDNDQPNSAKAGQVVPVRWSLLDSLGASVSDPASFAGITWASSQSACAYAMPTRLRPTR
jgi:hypothetical protein